MDKLLSLTIGGKTIEAPPQIPQGGLGAGGGGQKFIQNGISLLLIAALILSFIFILLSGIKWIMSGGDKAKIDSARKTLTYAIIGLILALCSIAIVNLVGKLTFGGALITQ